MNGIKSLYENLWDSKLLPACFSVTNNCNPPHFHSALELLYVEKGCVQAIINGKTLLVEENNLILVPNYNIHSYSTPSYAATRVLLIPLQFAGTFGSLLKEKTFCEYVYHGKHLPEIQHAMRQLQNGMETPNVNVIKGYVYVILGILTEEVKMLKSSVYNTHLEIVEIIQYIEKNFQNPISVKTVAREFGCSESHISHMFKEHVGCSFPNFLGIVRIKHAVSLIHEEKYSITDAAMEAGFDSLCTFYRTFKRYYDCTPYQYQKQRNPLPKDYSELLTYL